jgi:hypothetical protein
MIECGYNNYLSLVSGDDTFTAVDIGNYKYDLTPEHEIEKHKLNLTKTADKVARGFCLTSKIETSTDYSQLEFCSSFLMNIGTARVKNLVLQGELGRLLMKGSLTSHSYESYTGYTKLSYNKLRIEKCMSLANECKYISPLRKMYNFWCEQAKRYDVKYESKKTYFKPKYLSMSDGFVKDKESLPRDFVSRYDVTYEELNNSVNRIIRESKTNNIFHIEDPVIEKIMNRDLLVTNDPPIDKQYHKIHDEDIDRLF